MPLRIVAPHSAISRSGRPVATAYVMIEIQPPNVVKLAGRKMALSGFISG
jgi:hypothetical protein